MAFKYHGDLVFSTGEYKDKDGNDKKSWTKAGAVFQDSETGNMSIKFEAMPAGEWSGWMKIFTKDKPHTPRPAKDVVIDDIDDKPISLEDIPF